MKHVPPEYHRPTYVSVLYLASVLCILGGFVFVGLALADGELPWAGISLLVAAGAHYLYAEIAEDIAHTAWQVRRTAYLLGPALTELQEQARERGARVEAAERAHQEEMARRLAEARAKLEAEERQS